MNLDGEYVLPLDQCSSRYLHDPRILWQRDLAAGQGAVTDRSVGHVATMNFGAVDVIHGAVVQGCVQEKLGFHRFAGERKRLAKVVSLRADSQFGLPLVTSGVELYLAQSCKITEAIIAGWIIEFFSVVVGVNVDSNIACGDATEVDGLAEVEIGRCRRDDGE